MTPISDVYWRHNVDLVPVLTDEIAKSRLMIQPGHTLPGRRLETVANTYLYRCDAMLRCKAVVFYRTINRLRERRSRGRAVINNELRSISDDTGTARASIIRYRRDVTALLAQN